ncbi:small multidrug resistance pump [Mycolicibacterium neoaurum]|uniref:DMT family transporter n=1 Tax=Mycolicibacterium neoaurum TaxID=1795 RepID=UPI00056BF78F|nr:multidrug efflux SMR transporter [Mycolicibacterium neoaurum]SDC07032.1 small multidrug resistance pump [Mycolicibacterium neoaurum]
MRWAVLGLAILIEVGATMALRASEGFRNKKWIAPVLVGYGTSLCLLWAALRLGMPVGVAYGVWTACGVALVAVTARLLFNDPLTVKMTVGIILIVSGVLTIELAGVVGT